MDNLPEIPDGELEYAPKTVSFPQISDEMVAALALGMEDELIVASRHGLSVEQYRELEAKPWFQLQVAAKRAEFERNGVTFKAKASWMAGELLDKVYLQAADPNASFGQTHEALKTLMKAAGLEAKDEKKTDSGPSFQISIDLGGGQSISLSNNAVQSAIDVDVKEIPNG
jgi:hypothetical protein